jgi:hypothetical protein
MAWVLGRALRQLEMASQLVMEMASQLVLEMELLAWEMELLA